MLHCPCNQLPLAKHYLAAFSWRENGSSFPSKQLTRMKEPGLELNSSGVQLNSTQSSNYGMAPLITFSVYSSLGKTEHCLYNLHRKLIKTCAMHQIELVFQNLFFIKTQNVDHLYLFLLSDKKPFAKLNLGTWPTTWAKICTHKALNRCAIDLNLESKYEIQISLCQTNFDHL